MLANKIKKNFFSQKLLYIHFAYLFSCVTDGRMIVHDAWDSKPLSIATIPMFNQKTSPHSSNWQHDWIFRRERLGLIDRDLSAIRADLIIAQEALEVEDSISNSDISILSAGSLENFKTLSGVYNVYDDTKETELLFVSASYPFVFSKEQPLTQDKAFWKAFLLERDSEKILVVNLKLEHSPLNWEHNFIEKIQEIQTRFGVCDERLIVAGIFEDAQDDTKSSVLMKKLKLKDSSQGFCENINSCVSESPLNEIFHSISPEALPSRHVRILVSQKALIQKSQRIFSAPSEPLKGSKATKFGLTKIWPTKSFGWNSVLRLPSCGKT